MTDSIAPNPLPRRRPEIPDWPATMIVGVLISTLGGTLCGLRFPLRLVLSPTGIGQLAGAAIAFALIGAAACAVLQGVIWFGFVRHKRHESPNRYFFSFLGAWVGVALLAAIASGAGAVAAMTEAFQGPSARAERQFWQETLGGMNAFQREAAAHDPLSGQSLDTTPRGLQEEVAQVRAAITRARAAQDTRSAALLSQLGPMQGGDRVVARYAARSPYALWMERYWAGQEARITAVEASLNLTGRGRGADSSPPDIDAQNRNIRVAIDALVALSRHRSVPPPPEDAVTSGG